MYAPLIALLLSMASTPAPRADHPLFLFPVACTPGISCLIQKLVDHDPGPGRRDFRCGVLTTNGHDGTDIRLRTMADLRAGFAVVAAAPGRVLRTRDGEPDLSVEDRPGLEGKEAGNAVVIDHGNGWETQYSHLRQGSVRVHPGQVVSPGETIAQVGLSGNTEFPHLHFSIRRHGVTVDPFAAATTKTACSAAAMSDSLWAPPAALLLGYQPTAVIAAGLASDVPPAAVARRDPPPALRSADLPLILWVDALGVKAGDRQEFVILGPDRRLVHSQASTVSEGGLSWFAYSGKRAPASGWPKGRYIGRYTLQRGTQTIATSEIEGTIR